MPDPISDRHLAVLEQVSRALEAARTFDEVKDLRDKSEVARQYARKAKMGLDLQNIAAELKLRAERKAGNFLSQLKLRGGDRKSSSHDESLKLSDLGIDRNQSSRWQKEAAVSDEVFEHYLRAARLAREEITSQGLTRCDRDARRRTDSDHRARSARRVKRCVSTDACDCQHCLSSILDTEEIVELKNHYDLLVAIVQPLLAADASILYAAELQHAQRLMSEISDILGRMTRGNTS